MQDTWSNGWQSHSKQRGWYARSQTARLTTECGCMGPILHIFQVRKYVVQFKFGPVWTGSQNQQGFRTLDRTIGSVRPQTRTLDRTRVRFSKVQVQTKVQNWTLPSLICSVKSEIMWGDYQSWNILIISWTYYSLPVVNPRLWGQGIHILYT